MTRWSSETQKKDAERRLAVGNLGSLLRDVYAAKDRSGKFFLHATLPEDSTARGAVMGAILTLELVPEARKKVELQFFVVGVSNHIPVPIAEINGDQYQGQKLAVEFRGDTLANLIHMCGYKDTFGIADALKNLIDYPSQFRSQGR